jgi:hypothetical protein
MNLTRLHTILRAMGKMPSSFGNGVNSGKD